MPPKTRTTETETVETPERKVAQATLAIRRGITPPARQSTPTGSPYVRLVEGAEAEIIEGMAEGWTQILDPQDTEIKAMTAMRAIKAHIASMVGLPKEAIVTRKWPLDPDNEPKPVEWVFALAFKKGAYPGSLNQ